MKGAIRFMGLGARTRAALVRAAGDEVSLFATWWEGNPPKAGDGLVTPTGRRYLVQKVSPAFERNRRGALKCIVLPAGRAKVEIKGRWFSWWWRPRR